MRPPSRLSARVSAGSGWRCACCRPASTSRSSSAPTGWAACGRPTAIPGRPATSRRRCTPILRPEGRLDPSLSPAGRDPRVPGGGRRAVRRPAADPVRRRGDRRPVRRAAGPLGAHPRRRGHGRVRRRRRRLRAAQPARRPGAARPRRVRRYGVPLRRLAARPRPDRTAGRRRGHRGERRAVHPARRRAGCAHDGVPDRRPARDPQAGPAVSALAARAVPHRPGAAAAQPGGHLRAVRVAGGRLRPLAGTDAADRRPGPPRRPGPAG
jgi:hypothetical protein